METLQQEHGSCSSRVAKVASYMLLLDSWDFGDVRRFTLEKGIYTLEEVGRMEQEYKRYLAISLAYHDEPLPISQKVDGFWYAHLLYSRDYRNMTRHLGCEHIDHLPAINAEELAPLKIPFDALKRYYRESFGEADPMLWNEQCCKQCNCHVAVVPS